MKAQQRLDLDIEDLEDWLGKIEKSYNINFADNELSHVRTFGELCDHIIAKMKQPNADDCTTQQAFYKLINAIATVNHFDSKSIYPGTTLVSIFPRHNRRKQIAAVERQLGFKLNTLRPKHFIVWTFGILCLTSIIEFFFIWKIALIAFVLSLLLLKLTYITAKEFREVTVGELAEKMTQENYVKSRRNTSTVNRKEIATKIKKMLIHDLRPVIDIKEISHETIIVDRR